MKDVRFLEEALEEFLDQVAYYEERKNGLGERFRLAVRAATTLAATHRITSWDGAWRPTVGPASTRTLAIQPAAPGLRAEET